MPGTILRVGLTGNIGAGKSTVAGLFDGPGFLIVDADRLGHELLREDAGVRTAITAALGSAVLDATGRIDRTRLGRRVFADPGARRELEAILHPRIRDAEEQRVASWGVPRGVAMTEAALLVETGGHQRYNRLVVVEAPPPVRIERLAMRGMTRADAEARMAAQMSDSEKAAAADYWIDNSGEPAATRRRVEEVRAVLLEDLEALATGISLPRRQP
jgi:dephospho-CoA kinase